MSDTSNLKAVCRCCHTNCTFKALNITNQINEMLEIYSEMLHETFGLILHTPTIPASYTICDSCVSQLRAANQFKKQVEECEINFIEYCRNNNFDYKLNISDTVKCETEESYEPSIQFENGNINKANNSCKEHKKKSKNQECFECQICKKSYISLQKMLNHKNRQHQKKSVFVCDMCQKKFLHKNSLSKHIGWHMGINKKFICEICGYSFHDKTNLNAHLQAVHQKLKLYKCTLCPKRFAANKNLKIHFRLHSGERPYVCDVCHESFICSTYLAKHKEKHDNVNKYGGKYFCKVCNTVLNERHVFTAHMRSHVGLKPYRCSYCEKDFFSRFSLKRHNENQHNIEKFACKDCDAIFIDKTRLHRHFNSIHEKEKSEGCDISKNSIPNDKSKKGLHEELEDHQWIKGNIKI